MLDEDDRILLCRFVFPHPAVPGEATGVWAAPGHFQPRGELTDDQLAAEHLAAFRWWHLAEIVDHADPDLFSPRDLATPLTALLTADTPTQPIRLGL